MGISSHQEGCDKTGEEADHCPGHPEGILVIFKTHSYGFANTFFF
jgi:hypothetical protein